jgi:hypothetical protein
MLKCARTAFATNSNGTSLLALQGVEEGGEDTGSVSAMFFVVV